MIFFLHTVDLQEHNKEEVLSDAEHRLLHTCLMHLERIVTELQGHDQYQYFRAFTDGLQELIGVWTFFNYILGDRVIDDWMILQEHLTRGAMNSRRRPALA